MQNICLLILCLCAIKQLQFTSGQPWNSLVKQRNQTQIQGIQQDDNSDEPKNHLQYFCSRSTENYDCQITNLHLKNGQRVVFGPVDNTHRSLTFQQSTLEYLPKSLLDAFPYVRMLNLESLSIASIEENAFLNGQELEIIYLQSNRISKIPRKAFAGASNLRTIVLSGNSLAEFDDYCFSSTHALTHLYLDDNILNILPLFTYNTNLKILNASRNELSSIDDEHFRFTDRLETLDLSHNRLNRLNLKQFTASLNMVDVSYNELTEFIMPEKVRSLNAEYNQLMTLEAHPECILEDLNLAKNRLIVAPNLSTCTSLQNLDLSYNSLEEFQYSNWMVGLKQLNLAYNNIFEVHIMRVLSPHNLNVLDLSHNKLSYLPSLDVFKNLQFLSLNDNMLISIQTYFKDSFIHFKGYKMANNEWKCDDVPKFEQKTLDKHTNMCAETMKNVSGICCRSYDKPYNDRLNEILSDAEFHKRMNQKNCPLNVESTTSTQASELDVIRNAIGRASSERANVLKEIDAAKTLIFQSEAALRYSSIQRSNIMESRKNLSIEIEQQRKKYHVTKEGLISEQQMLERIIKFVQEKDTFKKGVLSRRQNDAKNTIDLMSEKKFLRDELQKNTTTLVNLKQKLKQDEKVLKREKELLERKINRNAPSIHGSSGVIL